MAIEKDNLQIEKPPDPIPRWARDLEAEVFLRAQQLIRDGWTVANVMKHLGIPMEKRASLYNMAQGLQRQRRFELFGEVKTRVVEGASELTPKLIELLKKLADMALSDQVSEGTQERSGKLMLEFLRMMMDTHKGEAEGGEVVEKPRISTEQAVQRIEEILKVKLA